VKRNIYRILYCLILPLCISCNASNGSDGNLECSIVLSNFEILLEDPIEIDLSKLLDLKIFNGDIYFNQAILGAVPVFNIKNKTFKTIGVEGKGPYEFISPRIFLNDNMLFIHDSYYSKISVYDIIKQEFIHEAATDQSQFRVSGKKIIHADSDTIYILTANRADPSFSVTGRIRSTFLALDWEMNVIDSLYSFINNRTISHFENGNDVGFDFPLFRNLIIKAVGSDLLEFDTRYFGYRLFGEQREYNELDFTYVPDYDAFITRLKDSMINQETRLPLYHFEKALENIDLPLEAAYEDLITSTDYFAFKLFMADFNGYLLYDIKSEEKQILCVNPEYNMVYMDNDYKYWVRNQGGINYFLLRSKIDDLNAYVSRW